MPKFTITGAERVRDVIEAPDEESAEKLFRAKYPAVHSIEDIRNHLYTDYVMIQEASGELHTAMRFVKNNTDTDIPMGYWRDAGQWGCEAKVVDGKLLINSPGDRLDNLPLIGVSQVTWAEDNEGYL